MITFNKIFHPRPKGVAVIAEYISRLNPHEDKVTVREVLDSIVYMNVSDEMMRAIRHLRADRSSETLTTTRR